MLLFINIIILLIIMGSFASKFYSVVSDKGAGMWYVYPEGDDIDVDSFTGKVFATVYVLMN